MVSCSCATTSPTQRRRNAQQLARFTTPQTPRRQRPPAGDQRHARLRRTEPHLPVAVPHRAGEQAVVGAPVLYAADVLRRGLHRPGLKKKYDLVLLDCPPLINLCCVNALAGERLRYGAGHPEPQSAERVPPLLGKVRAIIEKVNHDLGVLGGRGEPNPVEGHVDPDRERPLGAPAPALPGRVHDASPPLRDPPAPPGHRSETLRPHFPPERRSGHRGFDRQAGRRGGSAVSPTPAGPDRGRRRATCLGLRRQPRERRRPATPLGQRGPDPDRGRLEGGGRVRTTSTRS